MEVKVLSSKLVRPSYPAGAPRPDTTEHVPSSVFDKATYHIQMAIIYAFAPPGPAAADIERGLAAVLGVYRLFAGQVRPGPDGGPGGRSGCDQASRGSVGDVHVCVVAVSTIGAPNGRRRTSLPHRAA